MFLVNYDCSFIDYPDPTDWANIFYFAGCQHNCKSCQNKDLQNFKKGKEISPKDLYTLASTLSEKNKTKKLVFSGGDPLSIYNINDIKYFSQQYGKEFDICIYTGYDINYVKQNKIIGFKYIKCGPFVEEHQRESGNFEKKFILASPNQNFYDANYNQISKEGILFY